MIEKLFEGCENLGWSVSEDQDAGTVELESYSPAGENLVVTVEKENFAEKVREYAEERGKNERRGLHGESTDVCGV